MPNMANITVKKADGTTDVVYVAQAPSAGDSTPARWTQDAASGLVGLRPAFQVQSQFNGNKDVRRVSFSFTFPAKYTDSTTGLDKSLGVVSFSGQVQLPTVIDTTTWNEAFSQLGNLLVSSLIRSSVQTGYSPT